MIQTTKLPIKEACTTLEISSQSFYRWKNKKPAVEDNKQKILKEIEDISSEFSRYGYRRVAEEMHRRDIQINHKRVYRLMKENNLLVRRKKYKPITTQSGHGLRLYPNLAKDLEVTKPNQLWVADITYISLQNEFIYLAAIIEIFSRACIGWDLSRDIDTNLTLNALDTAITNRKSIGFNGLIHHSDRGVQYASGEYVNRLKTEGIIVSMTESGNPRENAFAESFMKTLKVEEVYMNEYRTFEEAYTNLKNFIEEVYNKKRLHSSIGYVPPAEFEKEVLNKSVS